MRKFSKIIVLLLFVTTCAFADWTGSTSEPANMKKIDGKAFYVITSADELAWFAAKVNGGKTEINAVLGNDIVFGTDKNTTGTVSWMPIGYNEDHQFAGVFDGAGYTIYGLYVKTSKIAGFIGYLAENGVVKNALMDKGSISVEATYAGSIAAINYGTIEKSGNKNSVFNSSSKSGIYSGGIVGSNEGSITDCFNSGEILAESLNGSQPISFAGGIAGYNTGKIHYCDNQGRITSTDTTYSYSLSKLESTSYSGGIVGYNSGTVSNSYNSQKIESLAQSKVTNSAGGKVESHAKAYSGGIIGFNTGKVFKCYNKASVYSSTNSYAESGEYGCNGVKGSGVAPSVTSSSYSGGIGGYNKGHIYDCYSNYAASSRANRNSYYHYYVGENAYGWVGKCETKKNVGDGQSYKDGIVGQNDYKGSTKNSYYSQKSYTPEYWLNNTKVTGTAENMQKDQFAWILNTCNGTEKNSGAWTRGTEGYPTFANEDSLAIYKIVFDDDGATSNRYTNYKGEVAFPDNPEPADGYIFSGWLNSDDVKVKSSTVFKADQTVKAVYTDASDVFWTVNFYNAAPADTILETKSYQHGSIVNYGGVEPTLAATAKYTYKFKGWGVEPTNAVEDFDYHAVYDSTIRSYKISFNDYNGKLIENATLEYGKMPSCSKIPTRAATAEWKYAHKGWKPALDYVTEEASYTAIYDSVKVEYKVTFMNGVDVIDEQMVPYGDAAVAPTNVTREGYKFVGWNNSFAKVTGNLTIKAVFEELIIRTVNVVDGDGKKIDDQKVEDGKKYTLPDAPNKDGYTFDGWYNGKGLFIGNPGDKITVTEDLTLEAKYTVISYTITFANENGSEISSEKVAYGQMPTAPKDPTKASTAQYTYSFKGWNPAIESVTSAAIYTAVFDSTLREYTVTFKNGSTTLQTSDVAYGTKPSYTGTTPTKVPTAQYTYSFKGWNPTIVSVTGAATYTAVFDSTLREYTVSFKNGPTTLQTSDVAYGTMPSYTETTPTKASTTQYSYSFKGWNPTLTSVTGAATYTAVFDSTLREFAVTFKNGSTTLQTNDVAYGTMPSYTGTTPTKVSTDKYSYTFKGWNPTIASVTGAATYTAVFDSLLREFAVTFKNGSTTLQTNDVAYGTMPSYTGTTPTKESTDKYTYTFKGWSPSLASVTDAATYTATFDSTLRKYTITFKNGTATLQTSDVAYGSKPSYTGNAPTKSSTDKYSYTFKGWSPTLASVTGGATYTAVFDSTLRKYTITFKNGSTTLQTSDIAYGTKPSYTGSTPTKKATDKYTYEFKGWNPAIATVTKAATYQAVFDSSKVTGIIEGRLASSGVAVRVVSRSVQISAAPKNSTYAILDMQGRVLLSGRVESANFNIAVPKAGNYLVRVGNVTRVVQVK